MMQGAAEVAAGPVGPLRGWVGAGGSVGQVGAGAAHWPGDML